jgi:hypothetical protein
MNATAARDRLVLDRCGTRTTSRPINGPSLVDSLLTLTSIRQRAQGGCAAALVHLAGSLRSSCATG